MPEGTREEHLLTSGAARVLGVTPETIRTLERTGRLRCVRVGHVRLFSREEVERLKRARAREHARRQKTAGAAGR